MPAQQLKQQLSLLQALQATLEQETACLKDKEFKNLTNLLQEKQNTLQAIADLEKALASEQIQLAILADDQLIALKKSIDEQLLICQRLNDINGRLVQLSMKSNKNLMQLLTQASGKNTVTYDQKGTLNAASLLGKNIKA